MNLNPLFLVRGTGLVAGGALVWIVYFYLKDRVQPEPRGRLAAALGLGVLAAVAAAAVFAALGALGWALPREGDARIFVYAVGLIGPVEEGFKFLGFWWVIRRWGEFDEPIDGVIYAAILAIGFAAFENVLYLPWLTFPEQLARAVASPIGHALFSSIWGYGIARDHFAGSGDGDTRHWPWGMLALSMVLHGLYDFFILAWGTAYVSSALALVIWVLLLRHLRRATAIAVAGNDDAANAGGSPDEEQTA